MTEAWDRLLADFDALAALTVPEQEAFLAARRRDDPAAADALVQLLAADARSGLLDGGLGSLLASSAGAGDAGLLAPTLVLESAPGPDAAAPLPTAIGRYEVLARIGRGGFGEVFRGFDTLLKREVAIKTCFLADDAARRRFLREAELSARLVHPCIVTIHDLGWAGEVPYLVQELLPGEDLDSALGRGARLPLEAKMQVLVDIAAGLAYAHGSGIVHRDIKPGNIRLLPDGHAKILDFGIARELGGVSSLTGDSLAIGTLAYMAPEQARGERPEARADVHAWGAVAYELLSGTRAFPGETPAALLYGLLRSSPRPLAQLAPGVPANLAALVDRCLAREPGVRYRDGSDLLAALLPLATVTATLPRRVPRARSQRRTVGLILVILALAVLGVLAAPRYLRPQRERSAPRGGRQAAASPSAPIPLAPASSSPLAQGPRRDAPPRASAPSTAAALAPDRGSPAGRRSGAAAPSPSGPEGTPAAGPLPSGLEPATAGTAAASLGVLLIDGQPWGELVRLVAADGHELPLPADRITPIALPVPAGQYTAFLRHPRSSAACTARVVPASSSLCRAELRRLRAVDLLPASPP